MSSTTRHRFGAKKLFSIFSAWKQKRKAKKLSKDTKTPLLQDTESCITVSESTESRGGCINYACKGNGLDRLIAVPSVSVDESWKNDFNEFVEEHTSQQLQQQQQQQQQETLEQYQPQQPVHLPDTDLDTFGRQTDEVAIGATRVSQDTVSRRPGQQAKASHTSTIPVAAWCLSLLAPIILPFLVLFGVLRGLLCVLDTMSSIAKMFPHNSNARKTTSSSRPRPNPSSSTNIFGTINWGRLFRALNHVQTTKRLISNKPTTRNTGASVRMMGLVLGGTKSRGAIPSSAFFRVSRGKRLRCPKCVIL